MRVEAMCVAAQRDDVIGDQLRPPAGGEGLWELTALPLPERENRLSLRFCRRSGNCGGVRRTSAKQFFTDPAMSLAWRCQQAKRQRLNLARQKKPIPVTPEPA